MKRVEVLPKQLLGPFGGPFPLHWVTAIGDSENLILFLHGLDGHWNDSWGQQGAPGAFLHRVAARFPGVEVASVNYPSAVRSFVDHPQLTVATLAQTWADQLADDLLGRYRRIAFVTHCLGGMVTLQALRLLGERRLQPCQNSTEARLFCLIMDTPLRWPTAALPAKLAELTRELGMNPGDLAANLAYFNPQNEKGPALVLASIASAVNNPLSVFEPLALARPQAVWQVPDRHENLSRAPGSGPFLPLSIAQACLVNFLGYRQA